MRIFKLFTIITLALTVFNCGDKNSKNTGFSIALNTKKLALNDTLNLTINNPKNLEITNVSYTLNGKQIPTNHVLTDVKLGTKQITATITYNGNTQEISKSITIFNAKAPELYTYEIINTYPHDTTSYTQGLEFYNGDMYESTGQRKASKLKKMDFETGETLKSINLDDAFFGEGLTVLNNKIYQLTWQAGMGFVYDVNTFEKLSSFKYGKSTEGWGLCNDGSKIYKSDGTEKIWTLNPETLTEESNIQAYTEKGKIANLNELEWVNGEIYANIYQKNGMVILNPKNGAVNGVIDFKPLQKLVTVKDSSQEVLNGIAYHPERKTFFVTGKNWDKLFEVKIMKK